MANKINYQLMLEDEIEKVKSDGKKPSLLLHACCAPCSTYVLEYLRNIFDITLFYYNPNISPEDEYSKRSEELIYLSAEIDRENPVKYIIADYEPEKFFEIAKGLEHEKEGGRRCELCYRLRLGETAKQAQKLNFDYFTTTLSISPHKDAEKLNAIGKELSYAAGCRYLYSDFKKKNGYLRSCELSKRFGLYRQDYCGCVFSKREALEREKNLNR